MDIDIRLLGTGDAPVLDRVAEDVFDGPVVPELAVEFLADAHRHLIVALADGVVVGMVSAMDYVHPDKPRTLWVNELGVAPTHQRRGIGRRLFRAMLDHGRSLGCSEAWVATEEDNTPARRLYEQAGVSGQRCVFYEVPIG